jgi:16S rRNA processing protein RimM
MSSSLSKDNIYVCLGVLLGPHGIRGAVKIKSFASPAQGIMHYGPLLDLKNCRAFEIESLSKDKGDGVFIAQLKGISNRDQSEALRGTELFIERTRLPEIEEEDSFYYSDLEGLSALDSETHAEVGIVRRVENYGGGDFLDIACKDGVSVTVPFTKEAVPQVNIEKGFVLCDREFILKMDSKEGQAKEEIPQREGGKGNDKA